MLPHPLVLVPALGSDERLWQPLIERLGDTVDTVVIRGEGDAISAMADSVVAQTPERFYLAGNSMGGYVALDIVLRYPERVTGLVLLNTSAIAAAPERRDASLKLIEQVENGGFAEAVATISAPVAPGRPDVSAIAAAMALDLGPAVFNDHQTAVSNRGDRRAELGDLTVPTLVITGDKDRVVPAELGEELAKLIPGAELAVLEGVGHLSPLEAPGDVATHLITWLERSSQ
ncbi:MULTISPECIES: alpha/beta fold hydrolase [Prauserella salsuginis group]|uniref:Alpha/beta fold hydrolase n=1 Tax=Prauserella salsuginis TaxID=387889 RepID=A0ABW6G0X1_9PSEU|nr:MULTISPECIES: alpha/beta hydrolase [Prauserella salsuginis group]MCR3721980.1 Pimeloyl-ACP methyl ester carboxylesterase [Prauserella flava]MCR3735986.1 Pimeloyl-ACP methyl ester carboxylesterase [Prauserella salsuginis]